MRESGEGLGERERKQKRPERPCRQRIQQCLRGARRKLAVDSVLKPPTNSH